MLKRLLKLLVFSIIAADLASGAGKAFIGKWKLNSSLSRMPDEMKVENKGPHTYSFDFGGGAGESIVINGTDQPGRGGTTLSVKADAPDTWIVERKKDGRPLLRATWKLSKDGLTLTDYYRQFEPDGSTTSMDYVYQRHGGGTGFAADWKSIKETMNSRFVLEIKQYEEDGLMFVDPLLRDNKNVKLDGKDYPVERADSQRSARSASVQRVDERTLEMTDKDDGKVILMREIKLSSDGKRLTMTVTQPGQSKPSLLVFERE